MKQSRIKIRNEEEGDSPLIPGLPYDLALNCLIRVSVTSHNDIIHVSKLWRNLLLDRDSEFYRLRSQLVLEQTIVYLVPEVPITEIRERGTGFLNRHAVLCPHKSQILVMGGEKLLEEDGFIPCTDFFIVDTLTRKIGRGPNMLFSTSAIARGAFGVMNNRLYVAGGATEGDHESSQWSTSVQCYDISSNTWRAISPLPFPIMIEFFFVRDAMFNVIGLSMDGSNNRFRLCYSYAADSWTAYNANQYMEKLLQLQEEYTRQLMQTGGNAVSDDFEELVKAKTEKIANDFGGLPTDYTSFFGTLFVKVTQSPQGGFKWKNMGDVGRLFQTQQMNEFHPNYTSLLPREALPSIGIRDDYDGEEPHFRAWLYMNRNTGIKTPHHTNWYDLPLLFYPVCRNFSIGFSVFMPFDIVMVCY